MTLLKGDLSMAIDFKVEGRIAVITLNRPESMNAINFEMKSKLIEYMSSFRDNKNLWVAIIRGRGKAFCAGADLKQNGSDLSKKQIQLNNSVRPDIIWKPFIAAIHGYCLGAGLEMALTCDLRIASEDAKLGLPEVKVGEIPSAGATQRLPRFIARCKAAELILMGQQIDAHEALRIGLINKVVSSDTLMEEAMQWAEIICQAGPLQVRAAKEAMIRGYNVPLEEGLRIEQELHDQIMNLEDFQEARKAFAEKRKPNWKCK